MTFSSSYCHVRRCIFVAFIFTTFIAIQPSSLFGQATNGTGTWNRTTAGPFNWAPPSTGPDRNWWGLGNSAWVSGLTSDANMTNNITADQTVELETSANALLNVSLLTLNIGDSTSAAGVYQNFTISAPTGGVLTIGTSSGSGAINSSNGTNTISAGITLGNAATFQHTTATGSLVISGAVTNGSNLLTIDGAGTTTISTNGIVGSGSGGLTKNGSGTLNLNVANTYTGTTTVNAGTLAYGVNNAIASGAVTVSGGTLSIGGFSDTVGAVTLTSGSITGTGGTLTGTSYAVESGSISAILGGSGVTLTKSTGGTVTLSAANTYTGTTTVSGGTLAYGVNNAIATGGVTVNTGGTVNVGTFIDTVGSVIINGGTISGTTGVLSSTANFDGRSGTVSAILGGSLGFDKSTAGSLTLSGVNSYTGATTINDGTLFVNGSLAAASTVTVNTSGTLAGFGTINGDVNVVSGTVAPGITGASTLTVDGDFSLNSSANLNFQLLGTNTTAGGGINDLITGVDDLTLDGTLNVSELVAGSFLSASYGDKWLIFNYSGVLTNMGLTIGTAPALSSGLHFVIDTSTPGQVYLAAVPEPGSLALLGGLSVAGAVVVIRRKRRTAAARIG